MSEIIRFDAKIRISKMHQIQVSVPKKHLHLFRADQPVRVVIYRRDTDRTQLKKEVVHSVAKKV